MKKTVSLILVLVLCLGLCACVAEKPMIIYDQEGQACVNQERISEIVEVVELTQENWRDYVKVYSYTVEEEEITRNEAGEIVSTETVTRTVWQLGAGSERYHQFKGVSIELKEKATGTYVIYKFYPLGFVEGVRELPFSEDFNLDEYEFISVEGFLYFVDIPKEAIRQTENGTWFSVAVEGEDGLKVWPAFKLRYGSNEIEGNVHITEVLEVPES